MSTIAPPHLLLALLLSSVAASVGAATPPGSLSETGLFADIERGVISATAVAYQPRFPLWTDGLAKRRWIELPPDTSIDGSDPSNWVFPVGTKLWKEFALAGRPIETRFMELTSAGWTFAAYVWNPEGTAAVLAPERGQRNAAELSPGVTHDIPGRWDCAACHRAQSQHVLGFSAVQLATGSAPSGLPDLLELNRRGLVSGSPHRLLEQSTAPSEAVGYVHGNCGHCHNSEGPLASLGLDLRLDPLATEPVPAAIRTTVDQRATATARSAPSPTRIVPGQPESSQLLERISTRDPLAQMPPLGTRVIDQEAVAILSAWIRDELAHNPAGQATPPTNPN